MARKNWHRDWSADPTPEEIRRRTAAIRESWTQRERRRRSTYRPSPWKPPMVTLGELTDSTFDPDAGTHG